MLRPYRHTITDSHAYWGPVALADGQTTQTRTHALSSQLFDRGRHHHLSRSTSQSQPVSIGFATINKLSAYTIPI